MLFRTKAPGERPAPLLPFVFRVREGFLIGLAMDPKQGAPCKGCVQNWLLDRDVWVEPAELSDLRVRRDLLGELIEANCAHTLYEIGTDGTATKMECAVFPHPKCVCDKSRYIAPTRLKKNTNFAFSPLLQLSSERHGTPNGNLWITAATGPAPFSRDPVNVMGSGQDKEISRFRAVDAWLQKASLADAGWRSRNGEAIPSSQLQTGRMDSLPSFSASAQVAQSVGIGKDHEEATLEALIGLTLQQTLRRYAGAAKNPMLIVGANNWLRERVPFFLLQRYDMHLLFYPNSTPCWTVGLAAFSRLRTDEKPLFVFSADTSVGSALEKTLGKLLEICPASVESEPSGEGETAAKAAKLNLWWTHWIYRCAKISLTDVLHLEPYSRSLDPWLGYLRDGQPTVLVTGLNSPVLPGALRTVVQVKTADQSSVSNVRSLHGIGTWSHFRDALV